MNKSELIDAIAKETSLSKERYRGYSKIVL